MRRLFLDFGALQPRQIESSWDQELPPKKCPAALGASVPGGDQPSVRHIGCGTPVAGELRGLGSARLHGWESSMPGANLTGEVFTADAGAGFDEGIVQGMSAARRG
jgi:hypothetical protein